MARKISRETLPRIFQTFNSLYSSMVRKKNATIVPPSKQLIGEYPPVSFDRLYQYYQNWAQIKRSMDTTHQKFMGAGIQIKSSNPQFQQFIDYWWGEVNAQKKFAEFFLDVFITGNGMLEIQYTETNHIGNIEVIPMWTIWRIFRDQFANEIKIVQLIDGVFKELDPQFYIHYMINNPERDAFGKSEFFAVANPRPVSAQVDPTTGQPVNPARVLTPVLDMQAMIQDAEMEIKLKMAKPKIFVKAPGMNRDDMAKLRAELEDPNSAQYVWVIDSDEIDMAEAKIDGNTKFDNYSMMVDNQIDISTGFASKVVKDPQGFSYSSSQTPFDVLDQRMVDMQADAVEMIRDRLIKPLALSWGFNDWDDLEVEVSFMPSVRRMTMEDIQKLPTDSVSPEEKREIMKKLNIPLDDKLWDEWSQKQDALKQQQMDALHKQAENGMMGQGGPHPGYSPKGPTSPTAADAMKGGSSKIETSGPSDVLDSKPKPPSLKEVLKIALKEVLAEERINLNPNVQDSTYNDIYVSQGIDDVGKPIITDPELHKKYEQNPDDLPGGQYEKEEEEDPDLEQKHMPDGVNVKDGQNPEGDDGEPQVDQSNNDDPEVTTPPQGVDKDSAGTGATGDYKDFYSGQNMPKEEEHGLPDGQKDANIGPKDPTQPVMDADPDPVYQNLQHSIDDQEKPTQLNKDFAGPQDLKNNNQKLTNQKQNQHVSDDGKDKDGIDAGKGHNVDKHEEPLKKKVKTNTKSIDKPDKKIIVKGKEDIAGPPASANIQVVGGTIVKPKKKGEDKDENEK